MTKICTNCDTIYPDNMYHCPRCNYHLEPLRENSFGLYKVRDESMRSKIIKNDESIRSYK